MAVSHTGTYVQLPKLGLAQILTADATNKKTLITADADGNKISAMSICNTDASAAHDVQIWLTRSAVDYLLHTVSVPLSSGNTTAVNPINAFSTWPGLPTDNDGQKYFFLQSGDVLKVASMVTQAAGKETDVMAVYGSF